MHLISESAQLSNGNVGHEPVTGLIGVQAVIQKVFFEGTAGAIKKGVVEIQAGDIVLFGCQRQGADECF